MGYLECLYRNNVELVYNDGVERLIKDLVIFRFGRFEKIDVLVLVIGFEIIILLSYLNIIGKDGIFIYEYVGLFYVVLRCSDWMI